MATQERYAHLVSLTKEQDDLVTKAKAIQRKSYTRLPSYADLVILGAQEWIKRAAAEQKK